jgi:hypothetical protein
LANFISSRSVPHGAKLYEHDEKGVFTSKESLLLIFCVNLEREIDDFTKDKIPFWKLDFWDQHNIFLFLGICHWEPKHSMFFGIGSQPLTIILSPNPFDTTGTNLTHIVNKLHAKMNTSGLTWATRVFDNLSVLSCATQREVRLAAGDSIMLSRMAKLTLLFHISKASLNFTLLSASYKSPTGALSIASALKKSVQRFWALGAAGLFSCRRAHSADFIEIYWRSMGFAAKFKGSTHWREIESKRRFWIQWRWWMCEMEFTTSNAF